jgi:hypothetical protein
MGAILGAAGGATGGFGTLMATKATVESTRYNRKLQNFRAELAAEDTREAASKSASANVVAIAKSGVRREGSPLEVLVNNAFNEERTASLVQAGVMIQSDLATRGADQAQIGGIVSAAASVLGGASQAASSSNFAAGSGGGGSRGSSSTTFGSATPHRGRNQNLFPG